jgi:hypothetical protein
LGAWYATVLFWQNPAGIVRQRTDTSATVRCTRTQRHRHPADDTASAAVFTALELGDEFIAHEIIEMTTHQLIKTASRSVLGSMNDFAYLAAAHHAPNTATDLLELSLRLAQTPCGPLYRSHVSPDREITAHVTEHTH